MKTDTVNTHRPRICSVSLGCSELSTDESLQSIVDANTDVPLSVDAVCPDGCDLTGQTVLIRDPAGLDLACAMLRQGDEGRYQTERITIKAPLTLGEHCYEAVLTEHIEPDGTVHEEVTTGFPLIVKAHTLHLNAWGWPSATAAGEQFAFKVSAKCSSACKLGGRTFTIADHNEVKIVSGALCSETWPGTDGLYFAQVEVAVPPDAGDCRWKLEFPELVSGVPHQGASLSINLRVVQPPDCVLSVETFDRVKQSPIRGIHVLAHPYRAFTDEGGIAKIMVLRGVYKLHVSGQRYTPYQSMIDVVGDTAIRVELSEPDEAEELVRFY